LPETSPVGFPVLMQCVFQKFQFQRIAFLNGIPQQGQSKRLIPLLNGHVRVVASVQRSKFSKSGVAPAPHLSERPGADTAMVRTSIGGVLTSDSAEAAEGGRGQSPRFRQRSAGQPQQQQPTPEEMYRLLREDARALDGADSRSLVELVAWLVEHGGSPDTAGLQEECRRYREELVGLRARLSHAEENLTVASDSLKRREYALFPPPNFCACASPAASRSSLLDGASQGDLSETTMELRVLQSKVC
jgi:hypothetical protein